MPASRQVSEDHASPRSAVMPRIRMPASENRAVSRISGGQSVTPILPATKAKLQSRQNSADIERQRIEAGAGNRDRGRERHGKSPLPMI